MSSQQFPHHILELRDGRNISYARLGEPTGIPVLFFHGTPGSRIECFFAQDAAKEYGFDVYALDRPGFGYSTPSPGRTLKDWVADVTEFADALKLNKFGIISVSGGGAYFHACASSIPERMIPHCMYDLAGVVSPSDSPNVRALMRPLDRCLSNWGRRGGPILRACLGSMGWIVKRTPEWVIERMLLSSADEKDKTTVQGLGKLLKMDIAEAYRQGADAGTEDLRVIYSDPGFQLQLKDIQVAGLQFWHGSRDRNVPYSLSVYKGEQVKGSSVRTFEGKGHIYILLILKHVFDDIQNRTA